jgi:hypothetical protein
MGKQEEWENTMRSQLAVHLHEWLDAVLLGRGDGPLVPGDGDRSFKVTAIAHSGGYVSFEVRDIHEEHGHCKQYLPNLAGRKGVP